MEFNGDNNSSDKDEKMKRKFDSLSETDKTPEKKEKPSKRKKIPLFLTEKPEDSKEVEPPKHPKIEEAKVEKSKEGHDDKEKPEVPIEHLDETERVEAASEYIQAVEEDARQELGSAIPESSGEAESAASVAFLEALGDKVQERGDIDDVILDEALSEAAQQLGLEEGVDDDTEVVWDNDPEAGEENQEEAEDGTDDEDQTQTTNPPTPPQPPTPPVSARSAPGGPVGPSPPTPPTPPVPPMPPPQAPNPPGPPGPPLGGLPMGPNFNAQPFSPNMAAVNPNINQLQNVMDRRHRARDLLVGGIVGYMIGRRRGRIRTEKKLLPVQEKLEKEVKQLHQSIADKELQIRTLAAKQFEVTPERSPKQTEKIQALKKESTQTVIFEKPEKTKAEAKELRPETSGAQEKVEPVEMAKDVDRAMPEVVYMHGPEIRQPAKEKVETKEKKLSPRAVSQLSLPMLLTIAEEVQVGNRSLRNMYEQGDLSKDELREAVKSHIAGEKISLPTQQEVHMDYSELGYEQKLDTDQTSHPAGDATTPETDHESLVKYSANLTDNGNDMWRERMAPDVKALFENPLEKDSKSINWLFIAIPVAIGLIVAAVILFT